MILFTDEDSNKFSLYLNVSENKASLFWVFERQDFLIECQRNKLCLIFPHLMRNVYEQGEVYLVLAILVWDNKSGVGLAGLLDWIDNPNLPGSTPGRSTPKLFWPLTNFSSFVILLPRLSIQSISRSVRFTNAALWAVFWCGVLEIS